MVVLESYMQAAIRSLLDNDPSAPQAGVPVIQAQGVGVSSWVSAVDILSLMSLILTLGAEVAVLIFGLWLLFRTTQASSEFS